MAAWGSCPLTHFDRQFLFFSGSLKNDYTYSCITHRIANICYTTMTHNISDLYGRKTVKCPFIVCTQTAHGNMSRGKNLLRKPVLIGPLEFDIVIVRDMSEKATENKVYFSILIYDENSHAHISLISHLITQGRKVIVLYLTVSNKIVFVSNN